MRTNLGGHRCNAMSLEQLIHLCCSSPPVRVSLPEHYSTCGAMVSRYVLYVRTDGYTLQRVNENAQQCRWLHSHDPLFLVICDAHPGRWVG